MHLSKVARYTKDFTPKARASADADTVALYHLDEGQGDVVNDTSGNGHHGKIVGAKWVKADEAPIVPAPTAKYGLAFDGRHSYVDLPFPDSDPNQPVTLEVRMRSDKASQNAGIMVVRQNLNWLGLGLDVSGGKAGMFRTNNADGSSLHWVHSGDRVVSLKETTHLAGTWDGKQMRVYVNGVSVTGSVGHPTKRFGDDAAPPLPQGAFTIGAVPLAGTKTRGSFFNGVIEEVRISKVARYDKDFTPAQRFETDKDTLALYHCDEGQGDVLNDSSGNGHHGKIVGAKWVKADGSPLPAPPADPNKAGALSFERENKVVLPRAISDESTSHTLEGWFLIEERGSSHFGQLRLISWNNGYLGWHWTDKGFYYGRSKLPLRSKPGAWGRWTHVAVVGAGTQYRLFVDGKLVDGPTAFEAIKVSISGDLVGSISGLMKEVRISKVARYDKDFTPAKRHEPDADTVALYHFDEGSGDVLNDSSGNKHHAKIVGATWVKADGTPIVAGPQYGLYFSGKGGREVIVESLKMERDSDVTIECYATPSLTGPQEPNLLEFSNQMALIRRPATEGKEDYQWFWVYGPHKIGAPVENGRRTHFAGVRSGDTLRFFINGKKVAEQKIPGLKPLDGNPSLGMGNHYRGTIDQVRISKTARYSKDFPPAPRLEHQYGLTVALYRFDEGSGDVLKDSSGNGHHGKIVGARWVKADGSPIRPPADSPLPKTSANPDRKAAEWVLSIGGRVQKYPYR